MSLPVGKQLQQARLARGLSLPDVQHRTRIRSHLLEAMENDDLSPFASLSYAKRFLGLYARFLGVDVQGYLDAFQCEAFDASQVARVLLPMETPSAVIVPRLPAPPVNTSAAPAMVAAVVAVLACGIAGAVIFTHWPAQQPTAANPPAAGVAPMAREVASSDAAKPAPASPAADAEKKAEPLPEPPILKALPVDEPEPEPTPSVRPGAQEVRRPLPVGSRTAAADTAPPSGMP